MRTLFVKFLFIIASFNCHRLPWKQHRFPGRWCSEEPLFKALYILLKPNYAFIMSSFFVLANRSWQIFFGCAKYSSVRSIPLLLLLHFRGCHSAVSCKTIQTLPLVYATIEWLKLCIALQFVALEHSLIYILLGHVMGFYEYIHVRYNMCVIALF